MWRKQRLAFQCAASAPPSPLFSPHLSLPTSNHATHRVCITPVAYSLELTVAFYRSQSQHKKSLSVKRQDGEPLTRVDLQYDMLHAIFADKHVAFTDPHRTIRGDPAGTKVTFRDLYVNALIHSPKCSKASRDKIRESPEFGNEFAMISLLSNVGRINTTMACEC